MSKMTYTKEKDGNNLRYVDMCIYIDEAMKGWDLDHPLTRDQEESIYKYIYLLYYALSCKKRYFTSVAEYDSYSLYCAAKLYIRLVDPRQFELDEEGNPPIKRIKSVLNYIKATMYGYKVCWRAENTPSNIAAIYSSYDPITFENNLRDIEDSKNKEKVDEEVLDDVAFIPRYIKNIIKEDSFKYDKVICRRLYISVLLTFLHRLNDQVQLKNIIKYYDNSEPSILWHLDESMRYEVDNIIARLGEIVVSNIQSITSKYQVPLEDIQKSLWDTGDSTGIFDE